MERSDSMKISLNLYQDISYTSEIVRNAVYNKDPLIFIVPESYKNNNVFNFIKETEEMQKSICVLDDCNVTRALAYLISFPDIRTRHVVFSSPKDMMKQSKRMIVELNNLMNQVKPINRSESFKNKTKLKLNINKR